MLIEPNAQRWRSVVVFDYCDSLICLGSTVNQVKNDYQRAFYDLFPFESRIRAKEIELQKWQGVPNLGIWQTVSNLSIPPRLP